METQRRNDGLLILPGQVLNGQIFVVLLVSTALSMMNLVALFADRVALGGS
jgi:hypothetical protein